VTISSVRSAPPGSGARAERIVLIGVAAIVAAATLLALASVIVSIPLHLPINYNEGWNAYHVQRLRSGLPLYPDTGLFSNNYPPLPFYLVAWVSRWIADPIVAGRVLSVAGFAVWFGLIVPIARRLGAINADAWIGAALFGTTMILYTEYVGINDPEMIGHVVQAIGLLILLADPDRYRHVAIAAGLCAAALCVKQTLVAVPIASVLYLAGRDWRSAGVFAVTFAVVVVTAIVVCAGAFGVAMLGHLFAPRAYIPLRAVGKTMLWTLRLFAPAAAAAVIWRRYRLDDRVRFCAIYAGVGFIVGAVLSGGEGINANVFFDAIAAVSLAAAVALTRSRADAIAPDRVRARVIVAFAVAPLVAAVFPAARAWSPANRWTGTRGDRAAAEADIALLTDYPGRALCEELALCFWAGKPVEADLFAVREQMLLHARGADELSRLVDGQAFSVIQLNVNGRALDEDFTRALAMRYAIARTAAGRRLYVPR
jgi:hypothetical protein